MFAFQKSKFRLDLSDEEAVHYLQTLIDESVSAMFAVVVEQIHKFAQVIINYAAPGTLELQQVCCRLVTLLPSSCCQGAFG